MRGRAEAAAITAGALLVALALFALFLLANGLDPLAVYAVLWLGGLCPIAGKGAGARTAGVHEKFSDWNKKSGGNNSGSKKSFIERSHNIFFFEPHKKSADNGRNN